MVGKRCWVNVPGAGKTHLQNVQPGCTYVLYLAQNSDSKTYCWCVGPEKGKLIVGENEKCSRKWYNFGCATQFHTTLATWSHFNKFLLTNLISSSSPNKIPFKMELHPYDRLFMVLMRLTLSLQVQNFAYRFGVTSMD